MKRLSKLLGMTIGVLIVATVGGCTARGPQISEEDLAALRQEIAALEEKLSESKQTISGLQEQSGQATALRAQLEVKSKTIEELQGEAARLEEAARVAQEEARLAREEARKAAETVPEEVQPPPSLGVLGYEEHHGDISTSYIEFAQGEGWEIKEIDVEPLTHDYLREQAVSILWIGNLRMPLSQQEIQEVQQFVTEGGGLLVEADPVSQAYTHKLLSVFGVTVAGDFSLEDLQVPVTSPHPLMADVDLLYLRGQTSSPWYSSTFFMVVYPPSYSLVQAAPAALTRPVIAAAEVGAGRIVIMPNEFSLGIADNTTFIRNALYWLQQETS